MNKSKLKIASFFAGNGGFDYAAQKAGDFETVYANEISRRAYETFEMNFPLEVDKRSIWDIKPEELPDFDVLCGGFPCQSFSSAGRQAGRQAGCSRSLVLRFAANDCIQKAEGDFSRKCQRAVKSRQRAVFV